LLKDYFKDYTIVSFALDITLIRPLFVLFRSLAKRLVRSKKSAAIVIGVVVAIIVAAAIVLTHYTHEVEAAFDSLSGLYVAIVTPVLGVLGLLAGVISKIMQYLAFSPEKTFGKSNTEKKNMGAGLHQQVGKMMHVRLMMDFIVKFLQNNRIYRNGRWYRVKLVISFDDLDRCKPTTIANVS
jgi:hypothetical protein